MCSNSDEFDAEGVVVISLNGQPPEHTIQKILEVETLPNPYQEKELIKGYEWMVDNKYYSATVILYALHEKKVLDSNFCDKIRATVFYFNGAEKSSFEEVLSWMPILKSITSEVQLLVCDNCDSDDSYRKKILNWCVENEFELIELNPSEATEDHDDSIFSKPKGYGRVIEALQSHMWSNLVMKRDKDQNQLKKEDTDSSSNKTSSSSQKSDDTTKTMSVDNEEVVLEDQWLQKVFEGEDPDGESFEALFSKFASLKEKANNLSGEERKKYAEKVAIAFWRAMGGEDEEIEGLDDE